MSSSKSSGSKTKRKIADEHRNFQEKWELEYFCSEVKDKIICSICNNAISVPKLYKIKRHYEQHKSKYDTYEGLMRQEKLKEFKKGMKKQQFMFTKVSQESEAAVHASYVLSEMIAKHSKPFTEGDFIKECLIKAAEIVCPGSVKTFQAISLSRNTVVKRVTDMARNLNDQIKEKSSCFEAFSIACDEIANDPDLDIHTKVCNIRKACRIYHVFYFGEENERGWTTITGVNKFDGLEAFNKMAQEQIAKASKNAKNKIIEEFAVKCSRKEAWGISVKEAEEALKMNFEERLKIINGKKEILLASRKSKKKQIVKQESDTDSDATSLSKPDAEDIQAGKHKVIKRKLKSDGIKQPNKKCKLSTQENNLEGQPKVHKDNKFVHDSDVSDSSESGILQSDDRVCLKCEKPSVDLVQCKGKCFGYFHQECLVNSSQEPLCANCDAGVHKCMICQETSTETALKRWWPAKVCHPKEVPHNIAKESPQIGEFPLYFFGTKNYIWAHRGRVFGFQEDDDERTDHALAHPGLTKRFNLALEEAGKEFAKYLKKKEVSMLEMKKHLKPPQFKMIKFNKPVGNVQVPTFNEKDYNRCDCNPNSESPCSCDVDCINRSLMFECNSNLCLAKEKCQNQRFQKREYPPAEPFLTESRGWGLRSLVDIKKGQFVNEYVGELIDDEECERRIARMHKENETNFYFLTIDKDHIIDAGPKGNLSRFLNHSCNPNLETQKWIVNGETRIGLFARYDIPAKTELTFNYNLECKGNEKAKCMCGADNCSKYIGVRPLNTNSKAKSKVGIKRKKAFEKSKRDDICVYCKNRGSEMISCSYRDCPKSAHYACSLHAIQSAADNRWKCPEHLCEVCQTVSSKQCSTCSKTYCRQHYRNFL
ncbi:WHSC1L1 [Cordylochernes scorpioides]|uniref:WHSC1L1 n=1 Tax=Cordylochernes scorpioides TaxID=51811 RepID=A0ABY6KA39_9ARAC|nr:WHSC1L1 [Cordylochernes scorpioides]